MAITRSAPSNRPNKSPKSGKRALASIWLILALLTAAAALTMWMFGSSQQETEQQEGAEQTTEELADFNFNEVKHIDELNELSNEVKPITFDPLIRDLRDYPPEFVDSKYIKKNKGKWTVQVMDVSEHEIITDYLNSRKDREKFAYFRYRDSNDEPRYLLTYGNMANEKSAVSAAKEVDFKLPANVKVLPEKVANYVDVIESYELSLPLKDLSANRAREVRLKPTQRELAAQRRAREARRNNQRPEPASRRPTSDRASNSKSKTTAPVAAEKNIRNSNDTDDTLSVQEKRTVGNAESGSSSTKQPSNVKPKPSQSVEPTKPDSINKSKPKPKPAPQTPEKSDTDQIKQLIDETSD